MHPERLFECFPGALRCDLHPIIVEVRKNVHVLMAGLLAICA